MPDDDAKQQAARLRHETAIRYREQIDRQRAEDAELFDEYRERLHGLGLTDDEVDDEWFRMVREATPEADIRRYEWRELLRRHRAGEQLKGEELEQVERILEAGSEDIFLNWRSDDEKEAEQ